MHVKIKICGMTDADAVTAACGAGADLLGFVFFPPSPRNLALPVARELAAPARGRAGIVALSVDADDALIDAIVATLAPDWLQLHGAEPPERCAELRRRHGLPVIKAFGIADAVDVAGIAPYLGSIDTALVDAKPPREATRPGGLGKSFDWQLLDAVGPQVPLMLSGGLDAANVGRAIAVAGPDAVDVSSGVESAPGRKDAARIADFVRAVRVAEDARATGEEIGRP